MDSIQLLPASSIGERSNVPSPDEVMIIRNELFSHSHADFRPLNEDEIAILISQGTTSDDWAQILVTAEFDPSLIKQSTLSGRVRIARMRAATVERDGLRLPVGISHSRIVSCDIGDNVAIHDVRYLSHYVIGDRSILLGIDVMLTTPTARFGTGVIMQGEPLTTRSWIEVINESGSRRIAPSPEMITADAYLWAKYRDDAPLQSKLIELTQHSCDSRRGQFGTVGEQTLIKSCRSIRDVKIGAHAVIDSANALQNLTILSSREEPTHIGEGAELTDGIVGFGSSVRYGAKRYG